jgi:acyl carrier protein
LPAEKTHLLTTGMKKEDIVETVNNFLVDEFELESSQLQNTALLKEDLDIESLDFVDIAVIIEKEFGLKVTSEQMIKIVTLEDLYNFILEQTKN